MVNYTALAKQSMSNPAHNITSLNSSSLLPVPDTTCLLKLNKNETHSTVSVFICLYCENLKDI